MPSPEPDMGLDLLTLGSGLSRNQELDARPAEAPRGPRIIGSFKDKRPLQCRWAQSIKRLT